MSASSQSYHHGNLRNALIIAAAELIERDGTLDFSISEAAAIAGVSAAAPIDTLPIKRIYWVLCAILPSWGWAMWRSKPLTSTLWPLSKAFWPWAMRI